MADTAVAAPSRDEVLMGLWSFIYRKAHDIGRQFRRDPDDLAQAAALRVLKGFRRYRPDMGVKPITYFGKAAIREMIRAAQQDRVIRPPQTWAGGHLREIAAATTVVRSLSCRGAERAADLPDTKAAEPGSRIETSELLDRLRAAIADLPPRLRAVVRLRLAGLTYSAIGRMVSVTRERARQLELIAREKLRFAIGDGGI